jgi:hypothetical protein
MIENKKAGLIWGGIGSLMGGFCWIAVLGFATGLVGVAVVASLAMIGGVGALVYAANRFPERHLSIIGWLATTISASNFAALHLLYDKIPESVGGMATGKDSTSLFPILVMIAVFFTIGVYLILKDSRKKSS